MREQDSARRGGLQVISSLWKTRAMWTRRWFDSLVGSSSDQREINEKRERERETRVSNSSSSSSLNRRHFLEDARLSCNFVEEETSRTRGSKVFRSKRSFLDSLEFTGISGVNCPQGPC